jgi:hypothetical protein
LAVPEKLRRAAGRLLVALAPVQDLFLCAKHLFVAAIVNWGASGLAPSRSLHGPVPPSILGFHGSQWRGAFGASSRKPATAALDTGLGLHGADVSVEQERDDARR